MNIQLKLTTADDKDTVKAIMRNKLRLIFTGYLDQQSLTESEIREQIDEIFKQYVTEDNMPKYYLDMNVNSISIYPLNQETQKFFRMLKL